jgi:predicted DNA-binding transcriptional regulator YafY
VREDEWERVRLRGTDVQKVHVPPSVGAAWRYRARVTVRAPADAVVARINPAVGVVTAVDDGTCVLETGADTVDSLAVHLGLLGFDFEVTGPPELVAHLRELATRYQRATASADLHTGRREGRRRVAGTRQGRGSGSGQRP